MGLSQFCKHKRQFEKKKSARFYEAESEKKKKARTMRCGSCCHWLPRVWEASLWTMAWLVWLQCSPSSPCPWRPRCFYTVETVWWNGRYQALEEHWLHTTDEMFGAEENTCEGRKSNPTIGAEMNPERFWGDGEDMLVGRKGTLFKGKLPQIFEGKIKGCICSMIG